MNVHTRYFFITGPAGQIECALDLPDSGQFPAPVGIALIGHPHPLYGGTMHNKVAQTLARAFISLGYAAARMNFRGVGESHGVHDGGRGEVDDMAALLAHMRELYPGLPTALAGFSFGTFVQAQLHHRLLEQEAPAERLALVGCAAGKWPIPGVPPDTILIHGEMDDTIPLKDLMDWARPQNLPVMVIPGADHFFNLKLQYIKNLVVERWHRKN